MPQLNFPLKDCKQRYVYTRWTPHQFTCFISTKVQILTPVALLLQLNFTFKDCKQHYVYTRWTPGYGRNERATGKILRQCFTMWPDSNGNICHMKRTMVTISEEEYDRVAKVGAVS